jgi:hypothetical protein
VTDTDLDTDSGADTPARSTPPARSGRLVIIALAVLLAIVAGIVFWATRPDDDSATPRATTTTAAPSTTASDEEPPGTDPAAVEPYITALLTSYDEITSQIVADPEIAADPNHELYTQLRELLDPNSEMTDGILQALVRQGQQGIAITPFGNAELPVTRTVDGDIATVSENQVRFPLCTRYDYRLETPSRIETGDGHTRRSEGSAVRVDGHWVVSRLESNEEIVECEEAT